MSEDNTNQGQEAPETPQAEAPKPDPIANIKGEMDRKFDTLNASFERVTKMLEGNIRPQAPATPTKRPSVFDNEDAYATDIEERATQRAAQLSAQMIQTQKAFDAEVARATANYPELNDPSSSAYKALKQKLETQDQSFKGTPQGFRMAVLEAAQEEGLIPSTKRKKAEPTNDDFSISGSSSNPRQRGNRNAEPTELETQFAQLIGAPLDNPKFKEMFNQEVKRQRK